MSLSRTLLPLVPAAAAVLMLMLLSCATPQPGQSRSTPTMIDPTDAEAMAALIERLEARDVIYVGETHDRYDHHLNQLAVIRGLHERGGEIAIGMEQFQRPFQRHVDDFVAGRIDAATLLERTEWDRRWRFDVGLYRDILDYAQRHGIPIVALNAPTETVRQVSAEGVEGLSAEDRAVFPRRIELARGDYRDKLESVFQMHGHHRPDGRLERFLEVQYVWDQSMARSAADFLDASPDKTLVVLAGSGHVLHDEAIPSRLRRLHPGTQAVLVTDTGGLPEGAAVDYVFAARNLEAAGTGHLAAARGR